MNPLPDMTDPAVVAKLVEAARQRLAELETRPPINPNVLARMQAELPPDDMLDAVIAQEKTARAKG